MEAVCLEDSMHTGDFIGRVAELAALSGANEAKGGQLVLLYGRRRIGKTYLLQEFTRNRRAIFYQATRQAEALELAAFTEAVGAALGPLPAGYVFPGWEAALDYLAEHSGDRRLAVILDEFPYLCGSTDGLPSLVQRWWTTAAERCASCSCCAARRRRS